MAGAVPAAAITTLNFNFGGAATTVNSASVTRTSAGIVLTATARRFTVAPGTLTSLSQTNTGTLAAPAQIQATAPGIGVTGGASAPQLDTNQGGAREAILLSSSTAFKLTGTSLSFVDDDDTLQIYGVNADDTLTSLGFGGTIRGGLDGATSSANFTTGNSGTAALIFRTPTSPFARYLFTTRVGGDVLFMGTRGQGYRIDTVSAAIVPEPATWALLIAGFGLVGAAARRRRTAAA